MSTPRPRNSTSAHPTRQQLDELDALLQRMLSLPVHQAEEEPVDPPGVFQTMDRPEPARPEPRPQALPHERGVPAPGMSRLSPNHLPPTSGLARNPLESPRFRPGEEPKPLPRAIEPAEEEALEAPYTPGAYPASYMVVESVGMNFGPEEDAGHASGLEPRLVPDEEALLSITGLDDMGHTDQPEDEAGREDWVKFQSSWQPSPQTWGPLAETWAQRAASEPVGYETAPPEVHLPIPEERARPEPQMTPPTMRPTPAPTAPAPQSPARAPVGVPSVRPPVAAPGAPTAQSPLPAAQPHPQVPVAPPDAVPGGWHDNQAPQPFAPPASAPVAPPISSTPAGPVIPAEPSAPEPRARDPWYLLPAVGFNVAFDGVLRLGGAPGRWFCGHAGRTVLGAVGILCLGAAAVLAVADGMGWTW